MAKGPCWVKCDVSPGMFSTEYAIAFGSTHPGGWASREYVSTELPPTKGISVPGRIQGAVIDEDGSDCLVDIPWESLGSKQVRVPKADVSSR